MAEADALERNGFWEGALAARDRALDGDQWSEDERVAAQLDQIRLLLKLDRELDAEQLLRALADAADRFSIDASQRHALLTARTALALDEPGPALDALDRYLDLDGPARAVVRLERAYQLERLGRLDDARHAADRAIADHTLPDDLRRSATWFVATILDRSDEAEAAIARYREVIESAPWPGHPDLPAATGRIASLSAEIDDPEAAAEAEAAWRTLINDYPARAEALTALEQLLSRGSGVDPLVAGIVRYRHAQYGLAREQFIVVLSNPASVSDAVAAEYYIAAINEDLDAPDSAVLGYLAAIERDPQHELAANARWWAAQLIEARGESAEELYLALVETRPGSEFAPQAATRHAWYAIERRDWGSAAQRFRDAANLGADFWPLIERQRLLLWSGIAYREARDAANAALTWERTINLLPGDWYALRAAELLGAPRPELDPRLEARDWLADTVVPEPQGAALDRVHLLAAGQLRLGGWDDAADAQLRQWVADHEGDAWALWEIATELDEAGEVSVAAAAAAALLNAAGLGWWEAPVEIVRIAYPAPWPKLVGAVEATDGVDPQLLYSLIRRESLYDPDARGFAGEIGLTQVIPLTSGDIAAALREAHDHERLARPETAIRYGAWYLGAQLRAFDGVVPEALAAYNAGPGSAARWLETAAAAGSGLAPDVAVDVFVAMIDFSSTNAYVLSVMESWAAYRALAAAEAVR